jgi:hypothetical protein
VADIVGKMERQSTARRAAIDRLAGGSEQVAQHVSHAVLALQFHDLVSQLMDHVVRRIGALDGLLRELAGLSQSLLADRARGDAGAAIADLRRETGRIAGLLESMAELSNKNPVAQKAVSQGDIELF